jgi:hypothetical protein
MDDLNLFMRNRRLPEELKVIVLILDLVARCPLQYIIVRELPETCLFLSRFFPARYPS